MTWKAEKQILGWAVRGIQRTVQRAGTDLAPRSVVREQPITIYDNWNSLTQQQAEAIAEALNHLEQSRDDPEDDKHWNPRV